MRLAAILLLLLCPAVAQGRASLDELAHRLRDDDPAVRASAGAELHRRGEAAIPLLLDLIGDPDAEVRRFARSAVARELHAGRPELRRAILSALVSRGKDALGFVPELEALGRRYSGELGTLARVASMRIAGTRQHVRALAAKPDAFEHLLAFDPERARLLRATYAHFERRNAAVGQLEQYLDLVAAANERAGAELARRIRGAADEQLLIWLDIAGHLSRWPKEIGPALAFHLAHDSGRMLAAVAGALLRGPRDWAPIRDAIRPAAKARLADTAELARTQLVLVAARAGLLSHLREEAALPTAAGIAALCALRAEGDGGADPVARLAALDETKRGAVLASLVMAGAHECVPLFLDRLARGTPAERRLVLAAADGMPAARELLPGLADVAETGSAEDVWRAVVAAARTDRRLRWPGTEAILIKGLTHPSEAVRERAVYACDDLKRLSPTIVRALERLLDDRAAATAMAWFLPNVRRLGGNAELLVPMLSAIVRHGPPAGTGWGGKSAVRWRRECLRALAEIRPMHPLARAAFRDGVASSDRLTRLFALRGFGQVERPERADVEAVQRAMDDREEAVRHAAGVVFLSRAWQEAMLEGRAK